MTDKARADGDMRAGNKFVYKCKCGFKSIFLHKPKNIMCARCKCLVPTK